MYKEARENFVEFCGVVSLPLLHGFQVCQTFASFTHKVSSSSGKPPAHNIAEVDLKLLMLLPPCCLVAEVHHHAWLTQCWGLCVCLT